MNKKEIKTIQTEVKNLDASIKNMNERFNLIVGKRDAGTMTAEKANARLDDLEQKITVLDWQRATTLSVGEMLGISYHDLISG